MPFLKKDFWWIRLFDFPRLQIFFLGVAGLAAYTFTLQNHFIEYALIVLGLVSVVWQASAIFPYTPLSRKQVLTCKDPGEHPVLSLVVMNVYMYNKHAEDAKKILSETDPDIIIAVETDHWWMEQLSELKERFPNHVFVPKDNTYGMLLFSKLQLINPEVKYILEDDVPSIHTLVELASGDRIRLYAVHPKPPAPGHSEKSTNRDAELISIGKLTRNTEEPAIVAGDLNDVAWSYTTNLFQRFSELLDPRKGRGMFNTFHARHKLFRWPLDHIFHSDHFQVLDIKTLSYFGSDHFPIYIKLCYMPAKQHKQDEPEADGDDIELAQDKLDRAKTS